MKAATWFMDDLTVTLLYMVTTSIVIFTGAALSFSCALNFLDQFVACPERGAPKLQTCIVTVFCYNT